MKTGHKHFVKKSKGLIEEQVAAYVNMITDVVTKLRALCYSGTILGSFKRRLVVIFVVYFNGDHSGVLHLDTL